MLAIERRQAILNQIKMEKSVKVSDLAVLHEVTEETIRRDLDKLENQGKVKKSYGGAILVEPVSEDPSFIDRQKVNIKNKQMIGARASELIGDGETIFIDMSTTALEVIKAVSPDKKITVITNSLEAIVSLSKMSNIKIISIGGTLDNNNLFMGGPMSHKFIKQYYADKTFFSVKGLDKNRGFMDTNEDIAEIKSLMVKNAREAILVVDQTKFDQSGLVNIINPKNVAKVVTDKAVDDEWMEFFNLYQIEVSQS